MLDAPSSAKVTKHHSDEYATSICKKNSIEPMCAASDVVWSRNWTPIKQLESKLRPAKWAMEQMMIGVTLRDRKRESWIREQSRVEDSTVQIKKNKWTWAGPVVRRTDNRWTTRATEWVPRDGARY